MNNKINATSLNLFILSSIFLLLISILNPSLIFDPTHIKHWSTYHRDYIVFVYNSLLYTEGLEQQHLDHPSLFTFIIFPFFYKLAFYIGYIDFYDLSGFLESQNINTSLSKLFFISRVCIQLFSLGTVLIFYKIVIKFSNKAFSSFLISFFFIISTGFSSASNRIESGLIAVFFLLLAFYLFLKFIEKNQKKNLMYLVFVFILIFSGMMQKKIHDEAKEKKRLALIEEGHEEELDQLLADWEVEWEAEKAKKEGSVEGGDDEDENGEADNSCVV